MNASELNVEISLKIWNSVVWIAWSHTLYVLYRILLASQPRTYIRRLNLIEPVPAIQVLYYVNMWQDND